MRVNSLKIRNWKSFSPNKFTEVDGFGDINILIGPNSHGKSNFGNALRLILHGTIDVASGRGIPLGKGEVSEHEFNNKLENFEIVGSVTINQNEHLVRASCKPRGSLKIEGFDKVQGKFFPVGTNTVLYKIVKSDPDNLDLMREKWELIRKEYEKFTSEKISIRKPKNETSFLSDVFLTKYDIPLIEIGSGYVQCLYFIFEILKQKDDCKVFLFEEPEKHMHPELQRKFLKYLSQKKGFQFFILTHSAAFIDRSITSEPKARVFRVFKKSGFSEIKPLSTNSENWELLSSLGYRPSILVITNFIIWVEGPTDKMYIEKWISSKQKKFKVGVHYSVMFYGGSLLKYVQYNDEYKKHLINLFDINPNSVIVIDSDKTKQDDSINKTKQFIKDHFKENNRLVWITTGRTIENYIPKDQYCKVLKKAHPRSNPVSYSQFANLTKKRNGHEIDKIKFANKYIYGISSPEVNFTHLDLEEKITELVKQIKIANT